MPSKSQIAIILSKLKPFEKADVKLEQYPTDSEIAAEMSWLAYISGDIEGKAVVDLGCGTGFLSIACVMLGATVTGIELDESALETARRNAEDANVSIEFIATSVEAFTKKVDTVIQNPPFGTKERHADREFLLKAFELANVVYSIHKTTTIKYIEKVAESNGFKVTYRKTYQHPLKASQRFHTKAIHRITVDVFRFERKI